MTLRIDFPATDLGVAESLVANGAANRVRLKDGIGWMTWDFPLQRWLPDHDTAFLGEISKKYRLAGAPAIATKLENWSSSQNVLKQLAKMQEFKDTQWNKDPYLVGVGNGVFNVKTLEFRQQAPKDYISMTIPTMYNPDAKSPRFDKFLEEVHPNEDIRDYLQKLLGTGLLTTTADQTFHFWYGDGSNGKGIFGNVISSVLGKMSGAVSSDVFMKRGDESAVRFALSRLQECRLLFASEVDKGSSLGENRVKQLSGEEPVVVEEKGKSQESVTFYATLIMRVNEIPKISDSSYAMMRRIRVVPFNQQFDPHQNRDLQRNLELEKEGILLWLLEGAHRYINEGLGYPDVIRDATREAVKASFECADFLQESIEITLDKEDKTKHKDIKLAYVSWAKENGQAAYITNSKLTEALKNFLGNPNIIHPQNVTTYVGIRLLSDTKKGIEIEL